MLPNMVQLIITNYVHRYGLEVRKQTCTVETRCTTSNCIDVYIISHWFVLQVELQYLLSATNIWIWDNNLQENKKSEMRREKTKTHFLHISTSLKTSATN